MGPIITGSFKKWAPGVLGVGTDDEVNLAYSLLNVFCSAMHLHRDIHMKNNIKNKLSLCVPNHVAREYMSDIFGRGEKVDLIHCMDGASFDQALKKLQAVWEMRHVKRKQFYEYFSKNKAAAVRETMTAGVQSMCGFGFT